MSPKQYSICLSYSVFRGLFSKPAFDDPPLLCPEERRKQLTEALTGAGPNECGAEGVRRF